MVLARGHSGHKEGTGSEPPFVDLVLDAGASGEALAKAIGRLVRDLSSADIA